MVSFFVHNAYVGLRRARRVFGAAVVGLLLVVPMTAAAAPTGGEPAPASVSQALATIPASAFDKVGGGAGSSSSITPPTVVQGQPGLTFSVRGRPLPGILYVGAEYCPYCAAERWAIAAALSRFGAFSDLRVTESSPSDVYPTTSTLSFFGSRFSSSYVAFQAVEETTNQPGKGGAGYQRLQRPTREQSELATRYDSGHFISGLGSTGAGVIPFIDIGNRVLVAGSSFSPSLLAGLSQRQIAADLHHPGTPVAQAILGTANYLDAAICAETQGAPAAVCSGSAVRHAAETLVVGRFRPYAARSCWVLPARRMFLAAFTSACS